LGIVFITPDQVQLSWPAVPGATSYHVYSSMDGGASYSLLASTTELNANLTVAAAETRMFKVRAVQ
jgi:fibronectin type 3 domain-containing protein